MGDLNDQLKGVTHADPPAAEPENDPKPKKKPDKGDDKGDERTLDNIHGEFARKFKEQEAKIDGMFAQINNKMGQLTQSSQSSSVTPDNADVNDLATYSVTQLENLKRTTDWGQVNEADKDAFEDILIKRRVNEALNSKLAVFTEQTQLDGDRKRFGQIAVDRFPELSDPTSEIAREVNAMIVATPKSQIESNPRIVLDFANDVAITKGVKPQRRRHVSGNLAPTRSAPTEETPESLRSDAEHDAIAARLSPALPRGKKFDRDRIRKKEQDVRQRIMFLPDSREDDLND